MAQNNTEKPKEQNPLPEKSVFPLERLRRDCVKLFGVTTSTFDGAAFGLNSNGKFTVEEIKVKIGDWQKKKLNLNKTKKVKQEGDK